MLCIQYDHSYFNYLKVELKRDVKGNVQYLRRYEEQKLLLVNDKERGQENGVISIKYLSRAHLRNNKLTTLIVDNEFAITVELRDSNELADQAIGLTTYSNSEATVLSYASIFETLGLKQN
jgi:hypothetical protein